MRTQGANPVSFILDGDIGFTPLYTPTENAAAVDLATKEVLAADFTVKQENANTEEVLKTWIVDKINGLPGMKVANVTVDSDSVSLTEGSLRMAVQGDSQNPHGTDGSFQFDVTLEKISRVWIKELNGTITGHAIRGISRPEGCERCKRNHRRCNLYGRPEHGEYPGCREKLAGGNNQCHGRNERNGDYRFGR